MKQKVLDLSSVCSFSEIFKNKKKDENGFVSTPASQIGYIRADHDGYRWWTTYFDTDEKLIADCLPEYKKEMSNTCAHIIETNQFKDLSVVRKYCYAHPEARLSDDEYNFYAEGKICYYWIRFIIRKGDYNLYLKAFKK